jgi:hypothetical protein
MNTKLGMLKQVALAACCAASVGAMPIAAHASSYAVSIGTAPAYYGGYYSQPYYPYRPYRRCFYDYYGYYHCRPNYVSTYYYGGPYYSPTVSFGYYRSWRGGDRDDWRWRDRRWH